ncbi:MAG: fibronectin type III-like domain-contianing protein, partial [Bacteroidales bacterium]|nr:fibronectin type III-like domain-contianing protein [Bacteroidales bacterium]
YKSVNDLPDFRDYSMEGRTYRYFTGKVLYPFGYGLSYSKFEYSDPAADKTRISPGEVLKVSVEVKNTSEREGEEVVQLYISYPDSEIQRPLRELRGFERSMIPAGESKTFEFTLAEKDLEYFNEETEKYEVEKGIYRLMLGPSSDPAVLKSLEIEVI